MTLREELKYISDSNDDNLLDMWEEFNPKIYYNDGKPYGAMAFALSKDDGISYLMSMSVDSGVFTIGMRRDIIRNSNAVDTGVIYSTMSDTYGKIRSCLERLGFDEHHDIESHCLSIKRKG